MFVGQYDYKLDSKGRVVIPSKFRESLRTEEEKGLYVTQSTADDSKTGGKTTFLQLYPESAWEQRTREVVEKARKQKNAEWYLRKMAWDADFCSLDKQWRINLPQRLIESAGLDREVKVAGVVNWMEIWDRNTWDRVNQNLDRKAPELQEDLYDEHE